MKQKIAKLLLLTGAMLYFSAPLPSVDAQQLNCNCRGILTTTLYVVPDAVCDNHAFNWYSYAPSGADCHNWCAMSANNAGTTACGLDAGKCYGGNDPGSWHYNAYVNWTGEPDYVNQIENYGISC